jgi:ABC-2 type transport system ATP-binding protein
VLILDEPSTGLDPAARIDLWDYLTNVRRAQHVTVLLTTHLMDEADRCDRLAILDRGRLLACDTPAAMKSRIGGDVITIELADHQRLTEARETLSRDLALDAAVVDGTLRIEHRDGHQLIPRVVESLPAGTVRSIALSKPTLEDVFVDLTGRRFRDE